MQPSARDEILELARRSGLALEHPPEVLAEAEALLAAPGFDDPALEDARAVPFVTIDNEDSRDLDQALFIDALADGGHRVHYALADAAYYVRRGSRLYAEALARGASFYLPGLVAPMLPVSLSEGLVSLNPEVLRRALVFLVDLDERGEVVSTRLARQLIESRAKLSYAGVQRLWDGVDDSLENRDFTASLFALREVGRRRVALAEARGVVHYPRIEVDIGFRDPDGRTFVAFEARRYETDRANEQISLLVNVEGALLLERHAGQAGELANPSIAAIYRVHPPPDASTLGQLAATSRRLVREYSLPRDLAWRPESETLAAWIARLHESLGKHPVALALQRQALLVNQRSSFSAEPGLHYGVGAPCYARFSSPMREVVGIHTHQEALEALGLEPPQRETEAELAALIAAANRAKERQHALTKLANQRVIEALLRPDLARPPAERVRRPGIVIGLGHDKAFVLLEDPPLELRVYARDLGERFGLTDGGTALVIDADERGPVRLALGQRVVLTVLGFDARRDRFMLGLSEGGEPVGADAARA